MRIFSSLLSVCLFVLAGQAQSDWLTRLHDEYPTYRVASLEDRRFKLNDLQPLLQALPTDQFQVEDEGTSVEGRSIYSITVGSGPTKVLLWSQMHGDEPTATAAIMDILQFLQAKDDGFNDFRATLLQQLTLVFVPMLNPDGAARYQRRNALGIDLNRDALRLTTPEAQLLKRIRDELNADWGFNLHDQSRFYGVGQPTESMATLAFLAPAYDEARSVNSGRERAMQLIAQLNAGLQNYIPGRVARYSDAFEERAFGDNMQRWGTSTILIESGGYPGDREKQYIRQLNFATILAACHSIATQSYSRFSRSEYKEIPYNRYGAYNDLFLPDLRYRHANGQEYTIDITFDLEERQYRGDRRYYPIAYIEDIGDLRQQHGYQTLDCTGCSVEIGQLFPELQEDLNAVQSLDANSLLRAGYAVVRACKPGPLWDRANLPLWVVGGEGIYDQEISMGKNPPLIIRNATGKVVYAIVNGQLYTVSE